MRNSRRIYSRQTSQMVETPTMDYRPIAFMTLMVLTFWLMLSYITDSYFIVFLIFSNFILLFACCISLSGYILRRFIDGTPDPPAVLEVSTISGNTPYIVQDAFPPSYEDAVRMGVVSCHVLQGELEVPSCMICATHHQVLKGTTTTGQASQGDSTTSTNIPNRDVLVQREPIQNSDVRLSITSTSSSTSDSVFLHDVQSTTNTTNTPRLTWNDSLDLSSPSNTRMQSLNSTSDELPPPYSEINITPSRTSSEVNERQQRRNYRHHKRRPPTPPHPPQNNQENIRN